MPKVLDNIELRLLDSLRQMLEVSFAADFCIGYFHIRGWRKIADLIGRFEGREGKQARVLVGMITVPEDTLLDDLRILPQPEVDRREMKQRETRLVEAFRRQLTVGLPDNATVSGLRQLARQLRERKVCVKLFLKHPLHAKLYLTYNAHPSAPTVAFVGSSNLTAPGLVNQGELNVDVTDGDAATKLKRWFEARWCDPFSRDISDLLAEIIETSWAREQPFSPYLVYLKIAYHLAFEALDAPRQYQLPSEFEEIVLDFQKEAILRVRRILQDDPTSPERRRIALVGDVVGMGKTLTATAVAKIFQYEVGGRCVVCCPPKLKTMWEGYLSQYSIAGEVVPYSRTNELKKPQGRCRLLILDESHHLRNRETLAWGNIRDFIRDQDAKVLLLSATPYNKHYEDLGNQLRLALDEKADLGLRPENYFRVNSEATFKAVFQASPRSLTAFEQSHNADDWRDLLKQFMVRRTRGYIIQNFAKKDAEKDRYYLELSNGKRSYFPKRVPITLTFPLDERRTEDQYARLFNRRVVEVIEGLRLPRYGLGQYVDVAQTTSASAGDIELLEKLSKAGERLIGYCKVNLFKRLESSGFSFLLSLERHVLRNLVYVHAIDNGLDLPVGTQDSAVLDTATSDADMDSDAQMEAADVTQEVGNEEEIPSGSAFEATVDLTGLQRRAASVYAVYQAAREAGSRKFRWVAARYFVPELRDRLLGDAEALCKILREAGDWRADEDAKLTALYALLTGREKNSKVLVFTQFADTARYLERELTARGLLDVEAVTASSPNPAGQVRRFSPISNLYRLLPSESPLRVLIATEVLSEGQNCQDAGVVVNYDLPWAIIRLIQRAGRVDRIGQDNAEIRIYSCLPAKGVEDIIALRQRLVHRLNQNREVIGTDERFFEEESTGEQELRHVYAAAPNVYETTEDAEDVDIPSLAQAVWQRALERDPSLEKRVKALPDQVYATRGQIGNEGALVYFKTADGYDSLMKVDRTGRIVSQSLVSVLKEAECAPDEPSLPNHPKHHEIVRQGIATAIQQEYTDEGALGPKNSARRRVYERLTGYRNDLRLQSGLFASTNAALLDGVINDLSKWPLTERAREILNRRLREGVIDADLAELVIGLREDGRLSYVTEQMTSREPHLICSVGLFPRSELMKTEDDLS